MGSTTQPAIVDSGPASQTLRSSAFEERDEASFTQLAVIVVALDAESLNKLLAGTFANGVHLHIVQDVEELEKVLTHLQPRTNSVLTPRAEWVKVGDDVWFDKEAGELIIKGTPSALRPSETVVLDILFQNQRRWMKASEIADRVASRLRRDYVSPHGVQTIIAFLRSTMGLTIVNKSGFGYKLVVMPPRSEWQKEEAHCSASSFFGSASYGSAQIQAMFTLLLAWCMRYYKRANRFVS